MRVQDAVDVSCLCQFINNSLAPLSSIEATIGGMNSFVRTICAEYPDLFDGKEVHLLNRREAVVLFETHRHLLLPNGSQFSSTPQTIRSLVRNIHFLKSRGITPSSYASQLSLLYASHRNDGSNSSHPNDDNIFSHRNDITHPTHPTNSSPPNDPYYSKYSAFGTVFSLFDQLLRDRSLVTESDILRQLLQSPLLLDAVAARWPHVIALSLETCSPLQRAFLRELATHPRNETALLTHHVSLAAEDGGDPTAVFDFPREELTDACEMEPFIGLLNRRFLAPKTVSLESVEKWKQTKETTPSVKVETWNSQSVSRGSVRLENCYSEMDEMEAIAAKIETILAQPPSPSIPHFHLSPAVASPEAVSRVEHYYADSRDTAGSKRLIGVFFRNE